MQFCFFQMPIDVSGNRSIKEIESMEVDWDDAESMTALFRKKGEIEAALDPIDGPLFMLPYAMPPVTNIEDEVMRKVESLVWVLMGDISVKYPGSFDEYLRQHGINQDEINGMSPVQKMNRASELATPQRIANILTSLDLIFEARYGWAPGTAGNMKAAELFEALDHALNYDAPGKRSVWEATK